MPTTETFEKLYGKLNAAQRAAVDAIDGPVMVVAGPGTGKTQVLALRIGNILQKTDTAPEQILALTFTEAGVAAMRTRLHTIMGVASYRVSIFTFHGFCNEIIARFPEHFPDLVGSRAASELDRIILLQKVFDGAHLEHLASYRAPYYYVPKTLSAIAELKREAVDPDALERSVTNELHAISNAPDYLHEKGAHKGKVRGVYKEREEAMAKVRELGTLYHAYEAALAAERMYDYDDMILAVVRRLETSEELRLVLQEEYQYLLTDEYQDGNGAQNKVLELLSSYHDAPNLFVVGDEDQAIYRFQGASHHNFTAFSERFPKAKIITLTENYRSTQVILDTVMPLGSRESLIARAGHTAAPVAVVVYETARDEANAIAQELHGKIKAGTAPHEIALFTRTNKELALYASALTRVGVPVTVQTKDDVLDDQHIQKLLTLLAAVAAVGEDQMALVRALHLDCFSVPELAIYEFARAGQRARVSLWQLDAVEEIEVVRRQLLHCAKQGENVSPAELLSVLLRETGLLSQILAHPDAELKLDKLSVLLRYVEDYTRTHRHARLSELVHVLALLDEYNVLDAKSTGRKEGCVQLSTAHGGKGLEFDHVYVTNTIEGNWGGRTSRTTFKISGLVPSSKDEEDTDERHLLYVAMTRARKELSISYPNVREDGKPVLPSHFLDLLPNLEKKIHAEAMPPSERAETLLQGTRAPWSRSDFTGFVRETFLERGLAVTALNNYLTCPWQYFYRNLLRVPEPKNVHLMFGNAVHETLHTFFDGYAKHEDLSREQLLRVLDRELERQYFTDKELVDVKKNGARAMEAYYDQYKDTWFRDIKNEFPIDVLLPVVIPAPAGIQSSVVELRLNGKLDKVEFLGGEVRVIDYKTGQHKSRNDIEGKTKTSNGDYKRQLVFYKLLLDKYEGGKYDMHNGVIEFVVPDDKGRCRREEFTITKDEVQELEETVQRVAQEIMALAFWDKRCDDKECAYCALRLH